MKVEQGGVVGGGLGVLGGFGFGVWGFGVELKFLATNRHDIFAVSGLGCVCVCGVYG